MGLMLPVTSTPLLTRCPSATELPRPVVDHSVAWQPSLQVEIDLSDPPLSFSITIIETITFVFFSCIIAALTDTCPFRKVEPPVCLGLELGLLSETIAMIGSDLETYILTIQLIPGLVCDNGGLTRVMICQSINSLNEKKVKSLATSEIPDYYNNLRS
jgi:hypothetical protein